MAITFPFDPDWAGGYKVEHAYLTEIRTARDKTEARVAQRVIPRKTITFSVLEQGARQRTLRTFMRQHQQGDILIPELTRSVPTTAPITAGQTGGSVELESVPEWVQIGRTIYVGGQHNRDEVAVLSITGTTIGVDGVFGTTHPAGAPVMPGLSVRLGQSLSMSLPVSRAGGLDLSFLVDPQTVVAETPPAAPATYRSRELFLKKPNWSSAPAALSNGFLESLDFQLGAVDYYASTDWNAGGFEATYLGRSPAEVREIEQFFYRMKGARGSFFMPTWEPDFEVHSATTAVLRTTDRDVFDNYQDDPIYRDVIARFRDGTHEVNRVTGIRLVNGRSVMDFATPWVRAPEPSVLRAVSWCPLWRLVNDTLTVEWITRAVAQFKLSFRQIREDSA